ncbi:MAG: prepilin-type N-terminal cleavage/methylation domain-containing protein [Oleibacter sp.]|nr:prepilin-type N-terminal cleavage/methylation domain-containing protein [Thalassolituus sp.]
MKRQHGLSLIEMVIAIAIISIAITATLRAFSVLVGRSSDPLIDVRVVDLAQLYLDEILSKKFDELTPAGGIPAYPSGCRISDEGEARAAFDDVDDYDRINNESPASIQQSLATEYTGFRVSISVTCESGVGANTGGAKYIAITIIEPKGNQWQFAAIKGNY